MLLQNFRTAVLLRFLPTTHSTAENLRRDPPTDSALQYKYIINLPMAQERILRRGQRAPRKKLPSRSEASPGRPFGGRSGFPSLSDLPVYPSAAIPPPSHSARRQMPFDHSHRLNRMPSCQEHFISVRKLVLLAPIRPVVLTRRVNPPNPPPNPSRPPDPKNFPNPPNPLNFRYAPILPMDPNPSHRVFLS